MAHGQHDIFFSRALLMLQKLSQEDSVSVVALAEEFNCDKRTIYRDIKRLHFFPIELHSGVLRLADGFSLENSKLESEELLIAELAFSAINGVDKKIDKKIQAIRSKISYPLFSTPYDIKSESYEKIDMDSLLLNKIEDAITKRNLSKIKSNDMKSLVEPYKIVAFDGFWYLFAKDVADEKIKTYLISHIQEFRATLNVFEPVKNIDALLTGVHTAWFEDGNNFEVKVKVKPAIAHYFKLKKHLSSQEIIREEGDGSLIVTFEVSSDEDVDNLIKAWLPHIEVIKPQRFRKRLVAELEEYIRGLKQIELR